jgi:hemerythrin-like metal-binding protein
MALSSDDPIAGTPGQRSIRMALMKWSSKYSVGVKTLNSQHTVLFDILNELHAAMMKGQASSVNGPLLHKLVDYTLGHFAAEEQMMTATRYPGLFQHRAKHHKLTRQVGEFVERYERGESRLNVELLNFLSDWLTNHILKSDKEYGPWLNERGVI